MLDLIGLVFEVIATIVVETVAWFAKVLFWPSRRPETPDAAAQADAQTSERRGGLHRRFRRPDRSRAKRLP